MKQPEKSNTDNNNNIANLAAAAPSTATTDRPIVVLFGRGAGGAGIAASLAFLWFRSQPAVPDQQVVIDSRGPNHLLQGLANQKVGGALSRSAPGKEKGK